MLVKLQQTAHFIFFFFNDTATTEIYTLSLHDALPISSLISFFLVEIGDKTQIATVALAARYHALIAVDRKSTRLNSSHLVISYAVFCLKKKYLYRLFAIAPERFGSIA